MKSLRWGVLTLAFVLASVAPVSAATADSQVDAGSLSVQGEESLRLLVTPEELASLGVSQADVDGQAKHIATLSRGEAAEQKQKQKVEEKAKKRLKSLPAVPSAPKPAETDSDNVISPMIYNAVCWPGNDYYSVYWTNAFGYATDCFADSGTFYPNYIADVYALRPGNNVGRMYYKDGNYFYWSPWRGKTMDTYYFNGTVDPIAIQIA
ncbi:hypothetical protein ABC337_17955 [Arthrobacter sp. 1P04PC]|uniref:hypothetical protein n=1 Tax=unclassified Arthrobacter TaxID=235627 RepID=UPI0039A06EE2